MQTIRNKLYYEVKPYLPARLRTEVRRLFAKRKRGHHTSTWPIYPGSEKCPNNWTRWPGNKKFAVVITHDVEGTRGLERCEDLMQIDKELGFRSSFNFVPEGEYKLSRKFRERMVQLGFEIGLHDLHHDGKLFNSRETFRCHSKVINHYLKQWEVVGFRAGFMLNQPDWLHDLEIQYDASSFDTDPFEPQPEGQKTIFPYWVTKYRHHGERSKIKHQKPATQPSVHEGYAELPYTLPQDSTLFVLLREKRPSIWLKKVDWIARHGGMVLVNVHPDYIQFKNDAACWRSYPVSHYIELLEHLAEIYHEQFWQPLPKEMARFVRNINQTSALVNCASCAI